MLTESVAIVLHLAEEYSGGRLLPSDVAERGQVYCWLRFAATELEQPLCHVARHTLLYPEAQRLPQDVVVASRELRERTAVAAPTP